jgi:hypothetical protein
MVHILGLILSVAAAWLCLLWLTFESNAPLLDAPLATLFEKRLFFCI